MAQRDRVKDECRMSRACFILIPHIPSSIMTFESEKEWKIHIFEKKWQKICEEKFELLELCVGGRRRQCAFTLQVDEFARGLYHQSALQQRIHLSTFAVGLSLTVTLFLFLSCSTPMTSYSNNN